MIQMDSLVDSVVEGQEYSCRFVEGRPRVNFPLASWHP